MLVVIQLGLALLTLLVGWCMPVAAGDPSADFVRGMIYGSVLLFVVSLVLVILRIKARRRALVMALCCCFLQVAVLVVLVYGQEWGWF